MIFLLLIIIGALIWFKYKFSAFYIFNPAIIVLGVFFLTTFVCAANYRNWGDISLTTFFVVMTGIMAFSLGHGTSTRVVPTSKIKPQENYYLSDIGKWKTIIVIIFMSLVTLWDFQDVLSLAGGINLGLVQTVTEARHNLYVENEAIGHSMFLQQGLYVCRVLAYIYIFDIFYSMRIKGEKFKFLSLLPVIFYFFQAVLSTGRTELIYIIYALLIINYCISMSSNNWIIKHDFKYTRQLFGAIIAFLIVFLIFSNARSTGSFNAFNTLSRYIGAPISALDQYIKANGIWSCSEYFGEETMPLYYSILNALGMSTNSSHAVLSLVYVGGNVTNIFTALRRYLHDYGYLGMLLIMFLLGYGYSSAFKRIHDNNSRGFGVIAYAFLSYPLVEISIEERFLSNLVSARTVYCLIYMYILYNIFFRKEYYEEYIE